MTSIVGASRLWFFFTLHEAPALLLVDIDFRQRSEIETTQVYFISYAEMTSNVYKENTTAFT